MNEFITDDYEISRKIDYKFPMLFKPCRELEPYISCYWLVAFNGTREQAAKLKPQKTVLIPDGGASLIFNINPSQNYQAASLWGVMEHPAIVYNQLSMSQGKMRTFGVDFKPSGLYRFCNIPMQQFRNVSPRLESISASLFNELDFRIFMARSIGEQIVLMDSFLLELLIKKNPIPSLINRALEKITNTNGNILIRKLADDFSLSERHLNRMFHEYIGLAPKTICRITRLRKVIQCCREESQTDFVMAAYDSGYFDQSHFIKDFKEFCGCTPERFKNQR